MACLFPNTTKYMQVLPYGKSSSINPDEVIDFFLPNSGFLDLKSLSMWYDVTLSSGGGGNNHAFPVDGESVIQCLEVFVNGKMVNCIQNYQQIYRILTDFGYYPVEDTITRYQMRNGLLNGTVVASPATSINGTYYARNWLGLLGEDAIVDLTKNSIHIRITISPRQIIASASVNDTFSLSNVYLNAIYYEKYDGDMLKKLIKFADFKSVQQYNPSTTQETYLKIFTKNVDYVIGTILRTTNKTINNALTANIGNTRFFERNGTLNNYTSWNFKVNQRQVYNYAPRIIECFESMFSIFPKALRDNGLLPLTNGSVQVADAFACGAKVGFINQEPEEVEISFVTTQGVSSIANYSLLFAKLDSEVMLN